MKSQNNPAQPGKTKRSSQYDKIFKENIEAVIPNLIASLLHIDVVSSEEIPDDLQHTKERKPDVLKKITDVIGDTFILQIEFQVADEIEMVYRMADYYLMLRRKYKLPVRQYVLFVGPEQPKMPVLLAEEWLTFKFPLIVFSAIDYTLFLKSTKPEEVLLAVLGNFNGVAAEEVIRQVVDRIDETAQGDFSLKRYVQQLRVLAQLRNLHTQTDTIMDSLANYVSDEKDILYMRGERKERERIITNLLKNTKLTDEQLAESADVSTAFVQQIRSNLGKK